MNNYNNLTIKREEKNKAILRNKYKVLKEKD